MFGEASCRTQGHPALDIQGHLLRFGMTGPQKYSPKTPKTSQGIWTWNPNVPCFDWNFGLLLEGWRCWSPKTGDKQVPGMSRAAKLPFPLFFWHITPKSFQTSSPSGPQWPPDFTQWTWAVSHLRGPPCSHQPLPWIKSGPLKIARYCRWFKVSPIF